jgi:nucleotide-binding universal stress UspA family protein
MEIKDILVYSDTGPKAADRIAVALRLARDFSAHLAGLYVIPPPFIPPFDMAAMPADFFESQQRIAREQAAAAEKTYRAAAAQAGIAAEWRAVEGDAVDLLNLHARHVDLTVVTQADPEGRDMTMIPDLPELVALDSGRPVLVLPYVGAPKTIGTNVLVAWNASRESTRAVNDALPFLQRAKKVTILAVNPGEEADTGDIPCADIALHLARHGVKAEAAQTVARDIDVGDVVLSRLADLGADLLVMGAYGHSRLRELTLGGVTRTLFRHMTVPVLLSH